MNCNQRAESDQHPEPRPSPRRWRPGGTSRGALAAACAGGAPAALAHGFGQRYDLPLPVDLYVFGAAATVALTFVALALFVTRTPAAGTSWFDLLEVPALARVARSPLVPIMQGAAVFLFLLTVAAGLFGHPDPYMNIAPVMVWVYFWVGLAYVSALAGNYWVLVNPWTLIHAWLGGLVGARPRPRRAYPAALRTWPAVVAFALFAWLELASGWSERPPVIGWLIVGYSLVTWTAMSVYGREAWLRHGEAFSVVFGLFAAFAPTAVRRPEADSRPSSAHEPSAGPPLEPPRCEWVLRPPAMGLLERTMDASLMVFTLLVLATVTFDGFSETAAWRSVLRAVLAGDWARPALDTLLAVGIYDVTAVTTAGIAVGFAAFAALYWLCSAAMARAAGQGERTLDVALAFVTTLVPIAIGYHLAHYLSLFAVWGQLAIALASDPFGQGWDLFGTAAHQIDFNLIGARTLWYAALVSIVAGHVVAVYLAHVQALRRYRSRTVAGRNQIPMLVLMVGYTMTSLWIIAQPVAA